MAKGIEMNGMLRGKRGGIVYSRVNGEQLSRARATQVANPKTTAQMAQRMIFATATHAYSIMKPIVDHSYEGVKYGSKTQQQFMKDTLELLRSRAANDDGNFLIPNVVSLAANPYIVSRGTLTSPIHIGYQSDGDEVFITAMNNPQIDGDYVVTAKSFCDALKINKGDQITLVAIVKDDAQPIIGTYDGRDYRRNKFSYARITIKADAADDDIVYSNKLSKWGPAVIVEGFENNFNVSQLTSATFSFGYEGDGMLAFGCIRSAKEGDKWLRSTTQLDWVDAQLIYNFNDMLPAWTSGGTKIAFESDKYLNNAEQEVVVTTPSLTSVAARVQQNGSTVVLDVASLSKGGYAGSPIVDNGTNKHPYTLKSNGHVNLQDSAVVVDGYITKEFAEKQLGTTIVVDSEWRGKTNTTTAEYELQQETGVDDYVRKITGYQGPGSFEMPALLVAIGTDNKAHFVVNDGQAVADDGTPAEYGIAYGTGSMTYSPLDAFRVSELKNYCSVVGNDSGTVFAIGDEITLETYNRITQEYEKLGYVW